MRAPARSIVVVLLAACGGAPPPAPVDTTRETTTDPVPATATERACFTGSIDNGVCHVFSAATEPLSLVAAHCRATEGRWLEACPTEGRVGTCTGPDGDRATYYGLGFGVEATRHACEAEGAGHVFTP
jgi:hypothetical protein